jgi:hypothetical protein
MNHKSFLILLTCVTLTISIQSCAKQLKDSADVASEERALVKRTISDDARAAQFITVLDDRDRLVIEHSELRRTYQNSMQRLTSNYHEEREALSQVSTKYRVESVNTLKQMLALIDTMKSMTTPKEWEVIAAFQLDNQPRSRLLDQRSPGEF